MTDLAGAAAQFAELARNLTAVGEGELHRELYQAINDAVKPALDEVRGQLPDSMPNRYARTLAGDLRLSVSKQTGTDPGVRVVASGRAHARRLKRLEGGVLAHPVYGNRRNWVYQTSHVHPGFFAGPLRDAAPRVREAIAAAVERVAAKAMGRL